MKNKDEETKEVKLDGVYSFARNSYGFVLHERHNVKRKETDHMRYYPTLDMLLNRYIELKLLNKPGKRETLEEFLNEYHTEVEKLSEII